MSIIKINHDPSPRERAVFAVAWAVFFAAMGGVTLARTDSWTAAAVLWGVAVAVPLVGAVVPGVLRGVFVGASYAAMPIGWVLSHVVLAVTYYLVLTPIGLVMRPFGHDPLERRFEPQADTYWTSREPSPAAERYFRQF